MNRKHLVVLALTFTSFACANYVLDADPPIPGQGDGGWTGDGQLPTDRDGSVGDFDGSNPGPTDGGGGLIEICATEKKTISLSPLDLMVVLDVSYSMDYDQKWVGVKSALKSFVQMKEFDGLGVGMQYFPLRAQCQIGAYETPAVNIATLPGVGPTIAASLDQQQMSGGTPTVKVMEGATAYTSEWAKKHPTHKSVIVLATDGMPDNSCKGVTQGLPNTLPNVLAVTEAAAKADPPVKTFVIGVGQDLDALNDIAQAGGTEKAILVDATKNADVAFLTALTQIRRSALGCEFGVPLGDKVKKTEAQVRFVLDEGPEIKFQQVQSREGCLVGRGWYFDDPGEPKTLFFCDDTCTTVTQGKTGQLFVEFGCNPT